MRSRLLLSTLLLAGFAIGVPHLAHASIPYWGPIIPGDVTTANGSFQTCAIGWAGVLIVANNIISFLLTITLAFVAPLMFAYAGFLYVVNPVNPSGRSHANEMMMNIVIGIVIALASWLIVDTLLSVLYNGAAGGPWYSLITSGGQDPCIPLKGSLSQSGGATVTSTDAHGQQVLSFDPNSASSGACSAAALQAVVPSLTTAQANTFACLAKPESTCGTVMANYNWNGVKNPAKPSTAYGAFQVTLDSNHAAYENTSCYQAAGVSGPLNCQNGFSHGKPIPGNATEQLCERAASNLSCSIAAAAYLEAHRGWNQWTADDSSSAQAQCISKYAGSS